MNNQFDERQIALRGKAFTISFIVAIVTIGVMYFLTDNFFIQCSNHCLFMILLWVPLTVCFFLQLAFHSFGGLQNTKRTLIIGIIFLLCGSFIVASLFFSSPVFYGNGLLTDQAGSLFTGICIIFIGCASCFFARKDSKNDES